MSGAPPRFTHVVTRARCPHQSVDRLTPIHRHAPDSLWCEQCRDFITFYSVEPSPEQLATEMGPNIYRAPS